MPDHAQQLRALNVWNADCKVCDKRVSVVAEWTPFEDGIRHVTCIPENYFGDELTDEEPF